MRLERTTRTLRRVLRTRYPAFLFGLPVRRGEIPIFTYHEGTPELAQDLQFLEHNGYRTLSLDEFIERGGKARAAREVLLTFDDARASVFQTALPILHERNARAVLFVPTHWVSDTAGRFMSWDDIRKCRDSGVFAVQSHAHRHALVHTSRRLAGFADPQTLSRYDIYDWPMRGADGECEMGFPLLGTPVYEAAPLLSTSRCYIESEDVSRACQTLVARGGGSRFFRQAGAKAELRRLHDGYLRHSPGRFMEASRLAALVASELELSRDAFRRHLGFSPRCLAFPWMVGNRASLSRARDTGIELAFGSALDFHHPHDPALAVRVFGRFKAEWLRLLPGAHRARLRTTLRRKIAGFASHHNLAH
jgi:peptidoglycan/xylan/chitin deacetylase (PgdA/CDA1 family)